jgi:S-adenosylmethionine:tRNA ribosyltransferase-isomerase
VVAVGTTVVRALETAARLWSREGAEAGKGNRALEGVTELFIRPGFRFKAVDALITNFHLPGTCLLFLVAAFAGEAQILAAYEEAIRRRYRFYSYGDAMLIA